MTRRKTGTKVLIIVENLPVPLDRRVWQEALSLRKAGYDVSVLCPRMKGYVRGREIIEGIRVYRHPLPAEARGAIQYLLEYSVALFWESLYALWIFLRDGFDIVQVCNPPDLLFLAALPYRLLTGVRLVFDFHDSSPEIWVAKGGSRKDALSRVLRLLERVSLGAADIVMTVNDSYKAMVARRGRLPLEEVYVVRNSPDIPEAGEGPPPARGQGARVVVGYIGVMGKQDGVEALLETIAYLVLEKGRRDIAFKLMGTGPELPRIKERAEALGLSRNVLFTGWVSGKEYVEQLASCDICVNADFVNDYNNLCSPNKVYEYMCFSKPIVQFPMEESSRQAEGACLLALPNDYRDLGDRIEELADDADLRRRLGAAGKRRFHELFTWERSERRLLEAYERVRRL